MSSVLARLNALEDRIDLLEQELFGTCQPDKQPCNNKLHRSTQTSLPPKLEIKPSILNYREDM